MSVQEPDLAAAFLSATGHVFVPSDSPWDEGLELRICAVAESVDFDTGKPTIRLRPRRNY